MTRSLYTKFLLGYLVFGLLGFIFIATMSSEITYQYLLEEKSDSLYDEANLLASTYSDIYQGKNISLSTANPQLQAVATYLKAQAWVINQKGSVVAETAPASHIGTAIDGFDPTVAGNRSYMTGRFFGMFDKDMLSVIAPITGNFNTYGYVVIHMPIEQIVHGKDRILNIVYITALVVFILSLIILLVFTKTVYVPLKKITAGAKEYAAGNLSHTINVTSADEMGFRRVFCHVFHICGLNIRVCKFKKYCLSRSRPDGKPVSCLRLCRRAGQYRKVCLAVADRLVIERRLFFLHDEPHQDVPVIRHLRVLL